MAYTKLPNFSQYINLGRMGLDSMKTSIYNLSRFCRDLLVSLDKMPAFDLQVKDLNTPSVPILVNTNIETPRMVIGQAWSYRDYGSPLALQQVLWTPNTRNASLNITALRFDGLPPPGGYTLHLLIVGER